MKITIVGLGYVGLPLAVEFAKKFSVIGYDINQIRIKELNKGFDNTKEINISDLQEVLKISSSDSINGLFLSSDDKDIKGSDIYNYRSKTNQ